MTFDLKEKLSMVSGITCFKVILIGRGFFHVSLLSITDQSRVTSQGAIHPKPGLFWVSQWVRDFNPSMQRQTNAQVWLHIYDLPLECWFPSSLFCIAKGAGLPLWIDKQTLAKENGLCARVLINVDLSMELPKRILAKRKELNFFVTLKYENLPGLCSNCGAIGHIMGEARSRGWKLYKEKEWLQTKGTTAKQLYRERQNRLKQGRLDSK